MGYSPALCSKSANFRHLRIQRKSTQTVAEAVILERFWRRFREFRTISRSWKNRPCSKPWAIPQAFCSKSAKFQPLQMHLESRQKVAQGDTNNFRTVLEAFQSVWRDFQDFTKSAMFKTMGYKPRPFAQNRSIFDPWEFTLNRHKQSRKHSKIILERFWRRFREFRTISRRSKNRPCSKPWAIAQALCSKAANFRHLRIHLKSTQTVAEAVTNHFKTVLEAFQRVSNDFQELKKSAMFKTMGYTPGLLLKIGQISTLTNAP